MIIINSPLEQFEIINILPIYFYSFNLSFTNSSLLMFFVIFVSFFWMSLSFYQIKFLPNQWQLIYEEFYILTSGIVSENLNLKGEIYFPFIFSLHMFLLFSNLLGMIPYSFTITSHIVFTFSLSFYSVNLPLPHKEACL